MLLSNDRVLAESCQSSSPGVHGHGEDRLSSLLLLPLEISAALTERLNCSLAPASLEKVVNGFYVLQMISPETGAEQF